MNRVGSRALQSVKGKSFYRSEGYGLGQHNNNPWQQWREREYLHAVPYIGKDFKPMPISMSTAMTAALILGFGIPGYWAYNKAQNN
ncbi:hypothetical protein MIR68_003318 [Amoeboaphelidium protococcarum]|nr:hypothetical protein MIR68_006033 [Amoeboaphelidium protococcarum]KAI3638820.1 hypothetical protein MIR68_003318 [Amoeboaphelidium protococcarum]KAI3651274.1 hypothetical protein MP228_004755 [Amoeboaphelidium protococcarum]KAI3654147.1 hypothetical protein MP228_000866 [Amoeboaphelidium protococcarum]